MVIMAVVLIIERGEEKQHKITTITKQKKKRWGEEDFRFRRKKDKHASYGQLLQYNVIAANFPSLNCEPHRNQWKKTKNLKYHEQKE